MPSWLPAVLTIADFITQRVDKAGPVSFEPPEKQPPELARTAVPSAGEPPAAADAAEAATSDRAPETETNPDTDAPSLGFQARGGSNDPSSGGSGGGGSGGEEDEEEPTVRCSFRSMRVRDHPTTYEV